MSNKERKNNRKDRELQDDSERQKEKGRRLERGDLKRGIKGGKCKKQEERS